MSVSIAELKKIVGDHGVLSDPGSLESYGRDWTRVHKPKPSAVVLPKTTAEVAAVCRWCHQNKVAVVPSGGRTGLAGGAVAANGEVVLALDRMNKIGAIDKIGATVEVEAGATTQAVQEAAADAGLYFGLDLAAKGSSQIGGNIAANAGGVKFIRYGGMREQVLGLEVVLPDGEVIDMTTRLRKNNTGYDLRQLFIGSEGTLGIITRATLLLHPPPGDLQLSLMAVQEFHQIPKILTHVRSTGLTLTAFEFFTDVAHGFVLKHANNARTPLSERAPFYVLLEIEKKGDGDNEFEPLLESLFNDGLITDAVIGQSSAEANELWGLRENITESLAAAGQVRKNDISLAIDQLSDFVVDLEQVVEQSQSQDISLVLFGHIGDGNLHVNYVAPTSMPNDEFMQRGREIEEQIFACLAKYRGSISAEHGIGLLKKADLQQSRTSAEMALMGRIKAAIDPEGLMNPGKIFDPMT